MRKLLTFILVIMLTADIAIAQRKTDVLDRGLVAVPLADNSSIGNFLSWRIQADEYYGVKYNVYRNGTRLNSSPLSVSNYTDASGSSTSTYQVAAVINGVEQQKCSPVSLWNKAIYKLGDHRTVAGLLDIVLKPVYDRNGKDVSAHYFPNDAEMADLDGDGQLEIIIKRINEWDAGNTGFCSDANPNDIYSVSNKTEFSTIEAYKLDGTRLWWIDVGPNMVSLNSTELDVIAYDWDEDGKAEVVLRGADDMIIHKADGTTRTVGVKGKSYRGDITSHNDAQYAWTHTGPEYLLYLNGETAEPYVITSYPLVRVESGETEQSAWVYSNKNAYGHRSSKYFFGAPFLDGRKASLFLARGIYTRTKMIAYDINPNTHQLSVRWRWECKDKNSAWFGNGNHNYVVADVDWDGRDEIVYGSMVIDDNGRGLSTTGLGHGDAMHCGDLDPYRHGQEVFACNEDKPSMNYRDATKSKMYYRLTSNSDDGRALCANFSNNYPGSQGRSVQSGIISTVTDKPLADVTPDNFIQWGDLNFRIYWDGDLCSEILNSPGTAKEAKIEKVGFGRYFTTSGCNMNNDSKNNPCFQGDILGDWREEIVLRCGHNLRIYTPAIASSYGFYSLWYDMQYRQAMVWQMMAYNQPPHTSFFLGEMEGITQAPPPLTMTGRVEIENGGNITVEHNRQHVLMCNTGNMTVELDEGVQPSVITDNAPTWVQGYDDNTNIKTTVYTHQLTGAPLSGATRLTKQGDGILQMTNDTHTHLGRTEVWAGTLMCDGTFSRSVLWLNRFANLVSDGGTFSGGITMSYASVLSPGGVDKASTINTTNLTMNHGARLVFDIFADGLYADVITANRLIVYSKAGTAWTTFGPKYLAPVFEFVQHKSDGAETMTDGKYLIGRVVGITGNLNNIVVEGLEGLDYKISYEGGNLYLVIGNPETYVQQNEIPADGMNVGTEHVAMTYGTEFSAVEQTTMGDKAVGGRIPNVDLDANNLVPTKGCFYKWEPNATGTLNVIVEMPENAVAYLLEDGDVMTTFTNDGETKAKTLQFKAREGYVYHLYVPQGVLPFYQYTFSPSNKTVQSYAVSADEGIGVRQRVRSVDHITMTYGGYLSHTADRLADVEHVATGEEYSVNGVGVTDTWQNGTRQSTSFDGFSFITTGNGQDARNEGLTSFVPGDCNTLPVHGTYYKFTPKRNGTLDVYFLLNALKRMYLADEDAVVLEPVATATTSSGISINKNADGGIYFTSKAGGKFSYEVKAGKTYFLFGNGTKLGFYGFSFVPDEVEMASITLQGDEDFDTSLQADIANVVLKRTFVANRWNSLILPFSMNEAQVAQAFGEGAKIALFDRIEDNKLVFKRHYYQHVVANKPCLVYVTYGLDDEEDRENPDLSGRPSSEDIFIDGVSLLGNAVSKTDFVKLPDTTYVKWMGVYDNTTMIPVGSYYISSSNFYRATSPVLCGPFKAFFLTSGEQGVNLQGMAFDGQDDIADGVLPIVVEEPDNMPNGGKGFYNMAGQRMNEALKGTKNLPKGVYIHNGRKVIVK